MKPTPIDLNDYVHVGEGANGASYNHKTDPNIMLKIYFRNFEAAYKELELAQKVYAMGIPTPEPGDLVTDGERLGIRFKRLTGKRSYSRACGDEPERVEEYAREFAQLCKKLHATHVDTTQFENVKDRLYKMLEENPFFTDDQKKKIHDFIAAVPDTDTATSRKRPQINTFRKHPRFGSWILRPDLPFQSCLTRISRRLNHVQR